ncbi:hypothetical protein ACFFF5_06765 [Lederbergia wuyishanensis]|uniref:Uncharacterized protein n=1 Tax=Lederbergia wuyishanensis TaxID=1347903 RepID=A0ABU0D2N6_9BACI|nr:hypothetical protein [Lederbergia wuyishanensis]MCJ8007193.1 hypothetical protein [Lederbergia wuyishanensis]MDQ0342662.1 hypothetical protein [Lederbergia wuyishanensis]
MKIMSGLKVIKKMAFSFTLKSRRIHRLIVKDDDVRNLIDVYIPATTYKHKY